uniref:Uncharacterized protein n=1 Tax=Crocodylus porosus TaxID=8502 RepID=A0A7M4EYM3_CROPO
MRPGLWKTVGGLRCPEGKIYLSFLSGFENSLRCSLLCAVTHWTGWEAFLCSGTSDRSCSLEFSGWLYSAIRMRQSRWAESNAKSKGKVMFIQWECLRQPIALSPFMD